MSRSGLGGLLCHLRGLVAPAASDRTDGELLTAYCAQQDQAAFAVLVKRHGPLVQAVCGRFLRRTEDKEDAFQATFLVLARDASLVRKRDSIAGWLHGVARHVALDARRAATRRHKYEEKAMTTAAKNPAWEAAWREVQVILDEEIQRLPDKYREPFVLCCLENQSRSEAAARLGLKEGTVGSRLTEARRRLRERLARRGVDLNAVLGTSALASGLAHAHVPAAIAANLANAAVQMASSRALMAGLVSARILSLVQGVPKAMVLTKAKFVSVLLLAVGILGSGVGAIAYQQDSPGGSASRQQAAPSREEVRNAAPLAVAAPKDNSMWKKREDLETPGWLPGSVLFAPAGNDMKLIVGGTGGNVIASSPPSWKELWKANVGGDFAAVALSADPGSILATFREGVRVLDAGTGKISQTFEEAGSRPVAVAAFPDKDFFAGQNAKFTNHRIIFASPERYMLKSWTGSGAPATISLNTANNPVDASAVPLAVDPEGRSVIVKGPIDRATGKNVLWAWVAGDNEPGSPGNRVLRGHEATVVCAAWSKNGKTAVTGDAAGRIILWDARKMKEVQRHELGGRVAALAFSPDADHLAAVVVDKQAKYYAWETATVQKNKPLYVESSDFSDTVYASLAFSPDGRQLAGCAINTAWLKRLGELVGHVHLWQARAGAASSPAKN